MGSCCLSADLGGGSGGDFRTKVRQGILWGKISTTLKREIFLISRLSDSSKLAANGIEEEQGSNWIKI